jgi:histidine ammonia-lyase
MTTKKRAYPRITLSILAALGGICLASQAPAQVPYRPVSATMADKTITLTGHTLTIDQLVQIARYGARVAESPDAMQHAADSFGLMLEAQAEGVAVYRFNRGAGSTREIVTLRGDPDSPEAKEVLDQRHSDSETGFGGGIGEEISDEEIGRAMLAVGANIITYEAASPAYVRGIVDLLNHDVTPAVHWHGAIGEADFVPTTATLTGYGLAYYRGVRMPASEALQKAGLKPIHLEGNDEALGTTSALTAGFAALLVNDLHNLLEWHDLIWSLDLEGMNGSIGPLSMPVQSTRPFAWANYAAARTLDMIKGSYVFNNDYRIIQDPESLRATVWRDGGAWQAWARLRDSALIQMNATDHNPTVRPGIAPEDSWELNTPQLLKFYVKGGKYSHGQHGFILSNSDWDPYPLVDDVEAFPIALTNLMVAVVQRVHRFEDVFFTVTDAQQVLKAEAGPGGASGVGAGGGGGAIADALWQELKPLANPIPPDGVVADKGVGDLDAVPMLKLMRLRQAMNVSRDILAQDLLNAAFWIDVRKLEKPDREFGTAPTALWTAFRRIVPFRRDPGLMPSGSISDLATQFLVNTSPSTFYGATIVAMPGGDQAAIPLAQPRKAVMKK